MSTIVSAAPSAAPSYAAGLAELLPQIEQMLPPEALAVFNDDAERLARRYAHPLKLRVGDLAPDFRLLDASGEPVRLSAKLAQGPVVLTFYRGSWCPYCNLQLHQLQQIVPALIGFGASLIAVSPAEPDDSLTVTEKHALTFDVLSDPGAIVTSGYTEVFRNGDAPVEAMAALGLNFDEFYRDDSRVLPVPATFVIRPDGRVAYAFSAGGDYRLRAELSDILAAVDAIELVRQG